MASRKQLGELLKEQQEPFTLEIYLLERGCKRNNINLERSLSCCSAGASSSTGILNLKRSSSSLDRNRRSRKVIPNCSRIAKAVLGKIVSVGNSKRKKSSVIGDGSSSSVQEICRHKQQTEELDRFSSASSTTVFNSCSDWSDTEEPLNSSRKDRKSATVDICLEFKLGDLLNEEIISGRNLEWRCREDNQQLSPVSVLEEIGSKEESPVHNHRGRNAGTGDSIFAVPFRKFIIQSSTEEKQNSTDPLSQYLASQRVSLRQSTQLFFDCVRETVEIRIEKKKRQQQQQPLEFLGPEELEQLLYEDVRSRNK